MSARQIQGWSYTFEYGAGQKMTGKYRVLVPRSTTTNGGVAVAMAITDGDIPQYGELLASGMYAVNHTADLVNITDDSNVVEVTVEGMAAHLVQNNFIFQVRASLQSEESSRDGAGALIIVPYTPTDTGVPSPNQTGTLSVLRPTAELTAVGVLDTETPVELLDFWIGKLNADACWGFAPLQLLCTDVRYEPIRIHTTQPSRYRVSFVFSVMMPRESQDNLGTLGWETFVYWKDGNGRCPEDATGPTGGLPLDYQNEGNGISRVIAYPLATFSTSYPFDSRTI